MSSPINLRRVLYTINGLDYGGREVQLVQLAKKLQSRGWDIHMVTMIPPHAFVDELEHHGIHITSLNMKRGQADLQAIRKMISIIQDYSPCIVHSHLIHAILLTRIARLFTKFPILISTIGNVKQGAKIHEVALKFTDFLCDLTTNVSQISVERYVSDHLVPFNKIQYIPNCIDTTRFSPSDISRNFLREQLNINSEFVWLAVGRLEPQKDYHTMISAFSIVVQQFSDALLLICGQGSLRSSIESFVHQAGLTRNILFLGVRDDIPSLMNAADGYVMSSAWEGMPGVLLEASATALPIVSTNVSGSCEIVLDHLSGFLVPTRNPEQLAQSMMSVMSLSSSEQTRMGSLGRSHVLNHFSLDKGVETWEKLYLDLIQQKCSGSFNDIGQRMHKK